MKSLLDILTKEKELVERLNRQNEAVRIFEEQLERIRNIDVDCKLKEDDINRYEILIENHEYDIREINRELNEVRLEIGKYFKELL